MCNRFSVINTNTLGFNEPDHTLFLQLTFVTSPRSVTLHNDTIMVHYDSTGAMIIRRKENTKIFWQTTSRGLLSIFTLHFSIVAGDAFSIRVIQSAFFLYMHLVSHSHNSLCVRNSELCEWNSYSSLHVQARSKPPTFQPTLWATATPWSV